MTSPNPILTTIIFVFALQAIVLGILLFVKKPRSQSNIFLSLLIFFFALMAFNIALVNVLKSYEMMDTFRYVQLELLYGIGPTLYFYTKSVTDKNFNFSRKNLLHFLPVLLEFLFYRTAFYRLGADGMYQTPVHPYTKFYLVEQWLGIISITIYTILALRILIKHQIWLKEHYSNIEYKTLQWLKIPIIVFSGFWIGWNLLTEIDRFLFDKSLKESYFLPAFVGLAVTTYWIGFKSYMNAQTETSGYATKSLKTEEKPPQPELAQKVRAVMEAQQPYLDPDLDLTKLAELLEMNPKQLSQIINRSFSKNFYEFVNDYRIEAFKKHLVAPESEKLTLLGQAFECGFKSKSTFNDVFKKSTGKTPSAYLKQMKNRSE